MQRIFLSLLLIGYVSGQSCPSGSIQFPNEAVCIYPFSEPLIYLDATRKCNELGGLVAKVQNTLENSYLSSYARQHFNGSNPDVSSNPFIGVQLNTNHSYIYADGQPITYQNWAPGQPANTAGYCVLLDATNVNWKVTNCNKPQPFFCTVPPVATTTPVPTVAVTTTTPVPTVAPKCDAGWTYFAQTGYCYVLHDGSYLKFDDAESFCRGLGAHLVSIHSSAEDDFVYNLVPRKVVSSCSGSSLDYVWIGLDNGDGSKGSGRWTDGTSRDYGFYKKSLAGYWAMPKISTSSGYCADSQYDYFSTLKSWAFGRYICKKRSY